MCAVPRQLETLYTGPCAVMPRCQTPAAEFAAPFQDLQNWWYHPHLVYSSRGVHTRWANLLPWWVRGRERWGILGTPRGHQVSQDERGGFRQDLQGISGRPHALLPLSFCPRLCREIIGWKHLSHPKILPLLGVSMSTNPHCFRILTEWMPNGNVMQYTRSNPEANRLRLVSPIAISPDSFLSFVNL